MKNKKKMKKDEFEAWQNKFAREMLVRVEAQCAEQSNNDAIERQMWR